MRVIRAKNQLSFWVIALTWLLVIGLPVLLFRFSLGQLLQNRYQQSVQRIKPLLFSELESFKSDLEFTSILEQDLRRFNRLNGFVELNAGAMQKFCSNFEEARAAGLKQTLAKHLGIPVFAVFLHGPDTMHVDTALASASNAEVSIPPRVMLRRFFSLMNHQHQMAPVTGSYSPAFAVGTDLEDVKTILAYHENFLQRLIGTAVGFKMEPDRVYRSTAGKIGDTGPVFMYYARSYSRNKEKEHNLGGYLAVIRASDIPESYIVRKASAGSLYKYMRRRVITLKPVINAPDNYEELGLTRFVEYPDRISLQTMATPRQIVRMIQKGSIVPRDFSGFTGQTTGIEVSCPKSELAHPLSAHTSLVDLFLKLFLLGGSLLMMRLYLFGFNLSMSLAFKTSAAVVAAAALPLLSLLLSVVAYRDFAEVAQNDRIQRYLKMSSARAQNLLAAKVAEHERAHRELAATLGKMSHLEERQIGDYLRNWLRARPVHKVMYKRLDAPTLQIMADGPCPDTVKKSIDGARLVLQSIVELILCSSIVNPDVESMSTVMTEASQNVEGTNSLMMSNGRLLNLAKFTGYVRIAFVMVFDDENVPRKPVAVTAVVYSIEKLVDEVLGELASKIPLEQRLDGMNLDFAFGSAKGRVVTSLPEHRSGRLSQAFVEEQLDACSRLQRELSWYGRQAGAEFFSLARQNQSLPVLSLVRITRSSAANLLGSGFFVNWSFPILIMLLVLILSRIFFIEPALQFSRGLEAIAGGDFAHRLETAGGDEFAELAGDFNQMARSLQEKEMLESYVSTDVLRTAKESSETSLQPGGEKIAATVAFISLLPVQKDPDARNDSAQIIARINRLLNLVHVLCSEHDGIIDKVIGHTLMVVFRESESGPVHQLRACLATKQLVDAVRDSEFGSSCRVAAGLACGQLVSGKIGSRNGKLDFTVIGDTVNLAARLKSYAESLDGSVILLSDAMPGEISGHFVTRLESEVQLKGKSLQTRIYLLQKPVGL